MIYFIQDTSSQAIKIGVSKKPLQRLSELQTAHHSQLLLIGIMDGMQQQERELHRLFKRRQGEWFDPSPDLLVFIRDHAVSLAHISEPIIPKSIAYLPIARISLVQRAAEVCDAVVFTAALCALFLACGVVALSIARYLYMYLPRDILGMVVGFAIGLLGIMARRLYRSRLNYSPS